MKFPSYSKFGGGWRPEDISGYINTTFPLLITPQSIQNENLVNVTEGVLVAAAPGTTHGLVLKSAVIARDLLGGGTLRTATPRDITLIQYSAPGAIGTNWKKYIASSDASGVSGQTVSATSPLADLVGTGDSIAICSAVVPSANCMMFLCVEMPTTETSSVVAQVGFDIGGYLYQNALTGGETLTGVMGMNLTDPTEGMGVVQTTGAGYVGYKGYFIAAGAPTPSTDGGRYARCMAINGTTASFIKSYNGAGSLVNYTETNTGPVDSATWTLSTGQAPNHAGVGSILNFGAGTSDDFGVYHMGIRNYGAAIPEAEVERVCQLMQATGKLPPWWL